MIRSEHRVFHPDVRPDHIHLLDPEALIGRFASLRTLAESFVSPHSKHLYGVIYLQLETWKDRMRIFAGIGQARRAGEPFHFCYPGDDGKVVETTVLAAIPLGKSGKGETPQTYMLVLQTPRIPLDDLELS